MEGIVGTVADSTGGILTSLLTPTKVEQKKKGLVGQTTMSPSNNLRLSKAEVDEILSSIEKNARTPDTTPMFKPTSYFETDAQDEAKVTDSTNDVLPLIATVCINGMSEIIFRAATGTTTSGFENADEDDGEEEENEHRHQTVYNPLEDGDRDSNTDVTPSNKPGLSTQLFTMSPQKASRSERHRASSSTGTKDTSFETVSMEEEQQLLHELDLHMVSDTSTSQAGENIYGSSVSCSSSSSSRMESQNHVSETSASSSAYLMTSAKDYSSGSSLSQHQQSLASSLASRIAPASGQEKAPILDEEYTSFHERNLMIQEESQSQDFDNTTSSSRSQVRDYGNKFLESLVMESARSTSSFHRLSWDESNAEEKRSDTGNSTENHSHEKYLCMPSEDGIELVAILPSDPPSVASPHLPTSNKDERNCNYDGDDVSRFSDDRCTNITQTMTTVSAFNDQGIAITLSVFSGNTEDLQNDQLSSVVNMMDSLVDEVDENSRTDKVNDEEFAYDELVANEEFDEGWIPPIRVSNFKRQTLECEHVEPSLPEQPREYNGYPPSGREDRLPKVEVPVIPSSPKLEMEVPSEQEQAARFDAIDEDGVIFAAYSDLVSTTSSIPREISIVMDDGENGNPSSFGFDRFMCFTSKHQEGDVDENELPYPLVGCCRDPLSSKFEVPKDIQFTADGSKEKQDLGGDLIPTEVLDSESIVFDDDLALVIEELGETDGVEVPLNELQLSIGKPTIPLKPHVSPQLFVLSDHPFDECDEVQMPIPPPKLSRIHNEFQSSSHDFLDWKSVQRKLNFDAAMKETPTFLPIPFEKSRSKASTNVLLRAPAPVPAPISRASIKVIDRNALRTTPSLLLEDVECPGDEMVQNSAPQFHVNVDADDNIEINFVENVAIIIENSSCVNDHLVAMESVYDRSTDEFMDSEKQSGLLFGGTGPSLGSSQNTRGSSILVGEPYGDGSELAIWIDSSSDVTQGSQSVAQGDSTLKSPLVSDISNNVVGKETSFSDVSDGCSTTMMDTSGLEFEPYSFETSKNDSGIVTGVDDLTSRTTRSTVSKLRRKARSKKGFFRSAPSSVVGGSSRIGGIGKRRSLRCDDTSQDDSGDSPTSCRSEPCGAYRTKEACKVSEFSTYSSLSHRVSSPSSPSSSVRSGSSSSLPKRRMDRLRALQLFRRRQRKEGTQKSI